MMLFGIIFNIAAAIIFGIVLIDLCSRARR